MAIHARAPFMRVHAYPHVRLLSVQGQHEPMRLEA